MPMTSAGHYAVSEISLPMAIHPLTFELNIIGNSQVQNPVLVAKPVRHIRDWTPWGFSFLRPVQLQYTRGLASGSMLGVCQPRRGPSGANRITALAFQCCPPPPPPPHSGEGVIVQRKRGAGAVHPHALAVVPALALASLLGST